MTETLGTVGKRELSVVVFCSKLTAVGFCKAVTVYNKSLEYRLLE